ncbi:MAG: hypothetical protein C0467_30180 [Planctomycetaceae bacterium]|nr:hypothetical protein [Planctomycetaceae bacterium]
MRRSLLTAAILLAFASGASADEKDGKYAKPGTQSGPPPGKGWRKNEPLVSPTQMATPAPNKGPLAVKPPALVPQKKAEGIGTQVSTWARSGIHGRQLAARIHKLQATHANTSPVPLPPTVKSKEELPKVPPPPVYSKKPKKDGKKGKDNEQD